MVDIAVSEALSAGRRQLRLCLAGSGGGHVRQLLDLEQVWSGFDYFFLTEDTALSRSLAEKHPTYFVPHVAFGQARLGRPFKMVLAAVASLIRSALIMLRERPDMVISTGAGAVFFGVFWARLLGAKIVIVESFARFDRPSLFGRLAAPLAHHKVVQSPKLASVWPDAAVFDPLKVLDGPRPPKKFLLFVTVGAILPFDRLVKAVAELKARGEIPERVIVQSGTGGLAPDGVEAFETLPFDEMQRILADADIVVCHGGSGSLITALRQGCRVVAMPRLFEMREGYDNHQAEIIAAFAARGLIDTANDVEELSAALRRVREKSPAMATSEPAALAEHLRGLIQAQQGRARVRLRHTPPAGQGARNVPAR